jgi:hypothetical protein
VRRPYLVCRAPTPAEVAAGENDSGAVPGERGGDLQSESGTAAGDDGRAALLVGDTG